MVFAAVLSAGTAAAQTEIKFGHVGAPGSLFDLSAHEFAKRANAKLGTKAKVVVYGSSQLGGDVEPDEKAQARHRRSGVALDGDVVANPMFGLFEMPYLVKRPRPHGAHPRRDRLPANGAGGGKAGYHIIGVWENGFRQITNNKRPIVKPEDLQGIKLRVPGGDGA